MTSTVPKSGSAKGKEAEPNNSRSRLAHKWLIPVATLEASLVVGTILTLANHGDTLLTGQLELSLAWIVPLNYVVALVLVFTSGGWMNWGGKTPLGSDAPAAHGERKLGGR